MSQNICLEEELKKLGSMDIDRIQELLFPESKTQEAASPNAKFDVDELQLWVVKLSPIEYICSSSRLVPIKIVVSILNRLFEAGAVVCKDYGIDSTPIHHLALVCDKEGVQEILNLLFDHGAPIDSVDYNGRTPQHVADLVGNTRVAGWICDRKGGPQ